MFLHGCIGIFFLGASAMVVQTPIPSSFPSQIPRLRASLVGFKQDNFGLGNSFYTLRLRWTEPFYWNDAVDTPDAEKNRGYNLNCYLENGGTRGPNLILLGISYEFQGFSEKFQLPPDMDLYVQCAIQARNAGNGLSVWKYSDKIRVNDVPVYLSGFEGIDVRGWSDQEIRNLKQRIGTAAAGEPRR